MVLNEPYEGDKPFIFLSYSHKDEIPKSIIQFFQDNGYRVWWDKGLRGGDDFREVISGKIKKCSFFITIASNSFVNAPSKYFIKELYRASDLNKSIIVACIDDTDLPDGIELEVGYLHKIFKSNYNDNISFIKEICGARGLDVCCDNRRIDVNTGKVLYKYVKIKYHDTWEVDLEWSDEKKPNTEVCKLYAKRTLYHGQSKIMEIKDIYQHIKMSEDKCFDYYPNEIWTGSNISPKGYIYANRRHTQKTIKYINLGKWVLNEIRLGEYSFNIITKEQYKYRYLINKGCVVDTKWLPEGEYIEGYVKA